VSVATTEVLQVPTAPPKGGKRRLLLVVGIVMMLIGAAAAWFLILAPDGNVEDVEVALVEGAIVTLEPQTTTLGEAKLHHARVAVAVVLAEGIDPAVVPPRAALLQDALLRELATMDVDGVRGAEGSDALRQRLSQDAREIWEEDQVIRIVLTELLVQ
jgi:flagellar protein FliL